MIYGEVGNIEQGISNDDRVQFEVPVPNISHFDSLTNPLPISVRLHLPNSLQLKPKQVSS